MIPETKRMTGVGADHHRINFAEIGEVQGPNANLHSSPELEKSLDINPKRDPLEGQAVTSGHLTHPDHC